MTEEGKLEAAIEAFKAGTLSLGEAAKVAGMDKVTFIEELGRRRVSVMNYPPEEIERELDSINKAREEEKRER